MELTFVHVCGDTCPINDREIKTSGGIGRSNEYMVPEVRCVHTNEKLKLVAVNGNRDI